MFEEHSPSLLKMIQLNRSTFRSTITNKTQHFLHNVQRYVKQSHAVEFYDWKFLCCKNLKYSIYDDHTASVYAFFRNFSKIYKTHKICKNIKNV